MKRLLIAAAACMLAACALEVTSVRSSWHVLNEATGSVTYIAVLNQGNSTIEATELILNPLRDRVLTDRYHSAWQLTLDPTREIAPGELVYFRADQFQRGEAKFSTCMIPVEIDVRIAKGKSSTLVVSQMAAGMPNGIPLLWDSACAVGGKGASRP